MSRWQRRVDDLLYDGESVLETVDVDTSRVAVTTHRVLAFTPAMDGENFQQAERPNVTSVTTSAQAEGDLLERGLRYGIIGAVLIVAGIVFDFGDMLGDTDLSTGEANQLGLGGIMDITQRMMALMQDLDQLLQLFGALALLLSVVILGVYWFLRDPTLVIELAGEGDNVHVPRPENPDQTRTRLEQSILPDPDAKPAGGAVDSPAGASGAPAESGEPLGEGGVGGGQHGATDSAPDSGSDTGWVSDPGDPSTSRSNTVDSQPENDRPDGVSETDSDSEPEPGWRDDL